jgi:hypothetical protein
MHPRRFLHSLACTLLALLTVTSVAFAQVAAPVKEKPVVTAVDFPSELVNWSPRPGNPIFTAEGPGHWDAKIRERGWILRDGEQYQLWFTGYTGGRDDIKMLGYATSTDGIHWTRSPKNPVYRDHWVEDMCVVRRGDTYYMFAEGAHDNHAEMLTSKNGTDWKWEGELDVRLADGKSEAPKPCGTPTVWIEHGVWYLYYEVGDKGVWLASTKDPMLRVWINVQDEPVLSLGPSAYDKDMIAIDQIMKYGNAYFAIYHGSGSGAAVPRTWNTDIAHSTDLVHWRKYPGNPIVDGDKSSGMVVPFGNRLRLYTMHDHIDVFESKRRP